MRISFPTPWPLLWVSTPRNGQELCQERFFLESIYILSWSWADPHSPQSLGADGMRYHSSKKWSLGGTSSDLILTPCVMVVQLPDLANKNKNIPLNMSFREIMNNSFSYQIPQIACVPDSIWQPWKVLQAYVPSFPRSRNAVELSEFPIRPRVKDRTSQSPAHSRCSVHY